MVFSKRGQSAIEFLIIVGALLFFAISFLGGIKSNMSDKVAERRNLEVNEIASIVKDEIVLASSVSDGYSRNFTLPPKVLSGIDYNITIEDSFIYVRTIDGKNAVAFPITANITGQPINGINVIRKSNGLIYLNT